MSAWIKRGVARGAAETLYTIGDWAWRIFAWLMDAFYAEEEEIPAQVRWLWHTYQTTMGWSLHVQEWGNAAKPWIKVEDEHHGA